MNVKIGMLTGFVLSVTIITWMDLKECHQIPWPPRIVACAITFSLLDLFSDISAELASVVAVGFILAMIINKGYVADCKGIGVTSTNQPQSVAFYPDRAADIPPSYGAFQGAQSPNTPQAGIWE